MSAKSEFVMRSRFVLLALFLVLSFARAGEFAATPGLLFAPSAEVTGFRAEVKDGENHATVSWQTSFEAGVQAFRVIRQPSGGTADLVGTVRSRNYEDGGNYELADPTVQLGDQVSYHLIMISKTAEQQIANWEGVVLSATADMNMELAEATPDAAPLSEQQAWIGNGDRVRNWTDGSPADRIRFSLTEEGVYRVTAQELADAGGWALGTVTNALATTNFVMSCQGEGVAWLPDDESLMFHGKPAESRWAPENVYWIEFGAGTTMQSINGIPSVSGSTNAFFVDHLFVQGSTDTGRPTYTTLLDAPFLALSRLFSGDTKQVDQELPGCAPGDWMGTATVNLHSWYLFETGTQDTHTGRVSVGSAVIGEPSWTGEQYLSFSYPFASSNLTAGTAALKIENIGATPPYPEPDYPRFFWMSYGLSYDRLYQAEDGALRCTGGSNDTVSVTGFATNDLVVLDVTVTNQPVLVESADITYDGVSSNWTATFACGDAGQVYQVCSKINGLRLPSVRGVRDVDWTAASNAVDYAILIPPEGWMEGFRTPLQELADFRNAQGLVTEVIDVESLYNQFSYGLVDAAAIEAFCQYGVSNWTERPLRYLLLGADGSLDFKHDKFTAGDSQGWFIPTRIAGQSFSGGEGMIVALDAAMGDIDDDHIPEVAIGRLPTGLTQEVATVVQKTMAYEDAHLRSNGTLAKSYAVVAPDWNGTPGASSYYDFDLACDRLVAPLEAAGRVHIPCRAPVSDPGNLPYAKTNTLFPELTSGSGLLYYFGHGNKVRLGYAESLLYYTDISSANWSDPVIMMILSCSGNVWHLLSSSATFIPYGLFASDTGFAASLGAAGFLLGDESEEMAVAMFDKAAQDGLLRLGDLHVSGLREAFENPLDPERLALPERNQLAERLLSISLVGDPAIVYRHDVTAMDTDVEWLVQYGQTNANADVADVDADGWATWREYQDNTNPTGNVLRTISSDIAADGMPFISFETVATKTYRVEYKPSLASTTDWQAVSWSTNGVDWNPAETMIVPLGPDTEVMVPDTTIETQGFFRIQTDL